LGNTEDIEDKAPLNVPPNTTIQALGIKASTGPNGYECSCSWRDKVPSGGKSFWRHLVIIKCSAKKKNRAECLADHQFHIDGWGDLLEKGHNFVRSIIVITKDF